MPLTIGDRLIIIRMYKDELKYGFFRDKTSKFASMRKSFGFSSPMSIMGSLLVNPDENENSFLVQYSNTYESYFAEIQIKLESLSNLYNAKIASASSFIEIENESAIDNLTNQIIRMLTNINKHLKIGYSNKDKVMNNLQEGYSARVRDLTKRFNQMQSKYLSRIEKIKSQTMGSINADSIDNDNSIDTIEVGFTQSQIAQVDNHNEEIERMNAMINEITEQLKLIKNLFLDLSNIIKYQGTILDRIDKNITEALNEVQHGNKELDKAEEHQKSKSFYVYLIGMVILIIILGSLVIIKKEKKRKDKEQQ